MGELSILFKLADGTLEGKLSTDKWSKMNVCSPAAAFCDIQHLLKEGLNGEQLSLRETLPSLFLTYHHRALFKREH